MSTVLIYSILIIVMFKAMASLDKGAPGEAIVFIFAGLLVILIGFAISKSVKMADAKLSSKPKDAQEPKSGLTNTDTQQVFSETHSSPSEEEALGSHQTSRHVGISQSPPKTSDIDDLTEQAAMDKPFENAHADLKQRQRPKLHEGVYSANNARLEPSASNNHKLANIPWPQFSLILGALFLAFIVIRMLSPATPPGYALPNAIGGFAVHIVVGAFFAGITWLVAKPYSKAVFLISIAIMVLLVTITQNTGYASFHDCMLQKMSGQPDNMRSVAAAECRRLFPN